MTTAEDAVRDELGDLAAYIGTLTAEESLGELLHIVRKTVEMPTEIVARLGSVLYPVAALLIEQLNARADIAAVVPDECTLHTCTLLGRAYAAAVPDGGAGS